jgi:hypothetical protein
MKNIIDAEIAWRVFLEERTGTAALAAPQSTLETRYIRLNPEFSIVPELDDVESLEELSRNTARGIFDESIEDLALHLIASTFYFKKTVCSVDETGKYNCYGKSAVPSPDSSNSMYLSPLASYTSGSHAREKACLSYEIQIKHIDPAATSSVLCILIQSRNMIHWQYHSANRSPGSIRCRFDSLSNDISDLRGLGHLLRRHVRNATSPYFSVHLDQEAERQVVSPTPHIYTSIYTPRERETHTYTHTQKCQLLRLDPHPPHHNRTNDHRRHLRAPRSTPAPAARAINNKHDAVVSERYETRARQNIWN